MLVGLYQEYGKQLLQYFSTPEQFLALVEHIRDSQVDYFGILNPPIRIAGEQKATQGGEFVGFTTPRVPNSEEFQGIMQKAEAAPKSPEGRPLLLLELLRSMAQSGAAERLARQHHVRFR